jgi:hypothetical protein
MDASQHVSVSLGHEEPGLAPEGDDDDDKEGFRGHIN